MFDTTKETLKNRLAGFTRIGKLIACLIALYYLYAGASALLPAFRGKLPALSLLPGLLQAGLGLAVIVLSLSLLFGVGRSGEPFTRRSVRLLRWIAWLLVVYEPLSALLVRLSNRLTPPVLPEGISVEAHSSMGLVLVGVGFAVMAISYVFEYGVGLQQLDDETL